MQALMIRTFDIVISTILLIVLSPIFVLIAVSIWITMGRPIFFKQLRLGLKRREFIILKFRTMRLETLSDVQPLMKVNEYTVKFKNDPRITPLGALLRKTSLDELPQLINVLRGDMSLVGPRPFVVEEYKSFPEGWWQRLSVKPGVTGLAQVEGRSDLPMSGIIDKDLLWAKNMSVTLYLKILLQTGFLVVSMKSVY